MPQFGTGTIADLAGGRGFRKLDGDDGGTDEDAEKLRELLADCNENLRIAYNKCCDAQMRVLSALSPEAKTVASVVGDAAKKEYDRVLDSKFEIEKRLVVLDGQGSRATIAKGVRDDERDLAQLNAHMAAINAGQVRGVDEQVRRRLLAAISQAEMRVAAAR